MNQLNLSDFQQRVMETPEDVDLFLGGGRGGGKSFVMALLCLRHAEQYSDRARMLFIRRTYAGLRDFELTAREVFGMAYGTGYSFNASEHLFRLPNGATLELGQLETHSDYQKYQGRSFTLLLTDEAGQYATPELLDILRSNLRAPTGIPVRMIVAANPGGVGHHWLASRYVFAGGPWKPFLEEKSKRQWVYAPSTYDQNPFIDREQYKQQLESSCPEDAELLRAWLSGDWAIARGAYFASVLEEKRNASDPWKEIPYGWETYLAHDFGSSAPSATYIVAKSPGGLGGNGEFFPRDSLVLIDELATSRPSDPTKGLGWTVPTLAGEIVTMCKAWKIRPEGVADDAIFARMGSGEGAISDEFRRAGVYFFPAKKADRLTGWNIMRRMLADAGKPDVPGLYITRNCRYFWQTVPSLARDPRRVEDLDSSGPDHAADAVRYACLRQKRVAIVTPLIIGKVLF